jgi:hypothetical protein
VFCFRVGGCYRKEVIEKWLEGRGVLGRAAENCYSSMVAVEVSRCGVESMWSLCVVWAAPASRRRVGRGSCSRMSTFLVGVVAELSSAGAVVDVELACRGLLLFVWCLVCAHAQ